MVSAPAKPQAVAPEVSSPIAPGDPLVIALPEGLLTDDLLIELSCLNDGWCFERNCEGGLEVSFPASSMSGVRGAIIYDQIRDWSTATGDGRALPSGGGYSLSIGSAREPDACWFSSDRFAAVDLSAEGYWPVCPDLIVEVRSKGQTILRQQGKMQEWMAAGARLGWLIDVFSGEGEVWVYREGAAEPERLERPDSLSGEDVAEGLTVDLSNVWR